MSSFKLSGGFYSITKHPNDVMDYKINWATWLGADSIAESAFAVVNNVVVTPETIDIDSESHTGVDSTVWVSGGLDGSTYKVTNTITTTQGRTEVKIFYIKVTVKDAG